MMKSFFAAILMIPMLSVGIAFAGSPIETVATMAHKATGKGLTSKSVEKTFFTADLSAFEKHIDGAHWQDFDGDPITGSQSPEELTVVGVSQKANVVTVSYSANGGAHSYRVGYVMVQQNGVWKVNDIIYSPVGTAKGGSFRKIMTDPVQK